jgi:hypothetical protein
MDHVLAVAAPVIVGWRMTIIYMQRRFWNLNAFSFGTGAADNQVVFTKVEAGKPQNA